MSLVAEAFVKRVVFFLAQVAPPFTATAAGDRMVEQTPSKSPTSYLANLTHFELTLADDLLTSDETTKIIMWITNFLALYVDRSCTARYR